MVGEGESFEKDLILMDTVPETRGEITEGTIREFKIECKEWERQRWLDE